MLIAKLRFGQSIASLVPLTIHYSGKRRQAFATSQPDHSTAVYPAIKSLLLAPHHSYVPKNLPVEQSNAHTHSRVGELSGGLGVLWIVQYNACHS